MKPTHVDLVFENCETITIPMSYIRSMDLGDISRGFSYCDVTGMRHYQSITNAYIVFSKSLPVAVGLKTNMGNVLHERLKAHNDITSIGVVYETYTEGYQVVWPHSDCNLWNNPNQSYDPRHEPTLEIVR